MSRALRSLLTMGACSLATMALIAPADAIADAATVVHVDARASVVVTVPDTSSRLRTVPVSPRMASRLRRGSRVLVGARHGGTRVVGIRRDRVRRIAFEARVRGTRKGLTLIRLGRGISVVTPDRAGRLYARGDRVRVTWRLVPRTGAVTRGSLAPSAVPRAHELAAVAPKSPKPKSTPTPTPTPTPTVTSPVEPDPVSAILFEDRFDGGGGEAPDPTKWVLRGEECDDFTSHSCPRSANVFQDGSGNLVLRVRREPSSWLGGGPYSGAFVGTFQYGRGWPPPTVKASWPVPHRMEMRAIMPPSAGLWPAAWAMNVDRTPAEGPWELDWAEPRMTYPTTIGCYQHRWVDGLDVAPWAGSGLTLTDMGRNWHVYSADVYGDRVEYRVDGVLCGVAPGVSGRFGLLLNAIVAAPGSWASGGGQPDPADPGPWDMRIDYVRVTKPAD